MNVVPMIKSAATAASPVIRQAAQQATMVFFYSIAAQAAVITGMAVMDVTETWLKKRRAAAAEFIRPAQAPAPDATEQPVIFTVPPAAEAA